MTLNDEQTAAVAAWLARGIGRDREYRGLSQIGLTPAQIAEATIMGLSALQGLHERRLADAMSRGNGSDMARHLKALQSIQQVRCSAQGDIIEAYKDKS